MKPEVPPVYPLMECTFSFSSIETGSGSNKAYILYEADPLVYDSGKMFSVAYRHNENDPDCVENKLLVAKYDFGVNSKDDRILDALFQLYPHFPSPLALYDTITRITLETIDGKLTATVDEDLDAIIHYPSVPSSLSHIPTVPIMELKNIFPLCMDVDRVEWQGQSYAFKRVSESPEGTLHELAIIAQLSPSPYIVNLTAIVVNYHHNIRGFLTPFMRCGNLENVFRDARNDLGLADDDDADAFDWPLKLSWAHQITHAVVDLHAISAYNGDLKPQNVLIDSSGHAILIDFLPMGISDEFAAPELVEISHRPHNDGITLESVLSTPADVYSLGLVLWAVAEEKWRGMRTPVWREEKTPDWYRDIVTICLDLSPEARPSSTEVLKLLERKGLEK
jgi:serine/threonine protein kinase